jgi:hypothetical protein
MTPTDIANRALFRIGESQIASIDEGSRVSKLCAQILPQITDDILREHRWNCATKRVSLSVDSTAPNHGPKFAYVLPGDFIRLMEVNGEQYEESDEFFEIEGQRLVTDSKQCKIRYIARVPVTMYDPSLTEAVICKLSAELAIPITGKVELQSQGINLYTRAIGKARKDDAIETGSRENRPMLRLLQQSPLILARGLSRSNLTHLINKFPRW